MDQFPSTDNTIALTNQSESTSHSLLKILKRHHIQLWSSSIDTEEYNGFSANSVLCGVKWITKNFGKVKIYIYTRMTY